MWEWLNSDVRTLSNGGLLFLLGLWFFTYRQSYRRKMELEKTVEDLACQMLKQEGINSDNDVRFDITWSHIDELTSASHAHELNTRP